MTTSVVHRSTVEPAIVQVTLADREHKNTFSDGIVSGLIDVFRDIGSDPTCKVVILTGYDTYFCSGGTQEMLLNLSRGQGKFTDVPIYTLPLSCEIPVISAMQGHGIGGGFALGLFADFVILGNESVYTANFMKYGFYARFRLYADSAGKTRAAFGAGNADDRQKLPRRRTRPARHSIPSSAKSRSAAVCV